MSQTNIIHNLSSGITLVSGIVQVFGDIATKLHLADKTSSLIARAVQPLGMVQYGKDYLNAKNFRHLSQLLLNNLVKECFVIYRIYYHRFKIL